MYDEEAVVDLFRFEDYVYSLWLNVTDDLRDKHNAFVEIRGLSHAPFNSQERSSNDSSPLAVIPTVGAVNATSEDVTSTELRDNTIDAEATPIVRHSGHTRPLPLILFHYGSYEGGLSLEEALSPDTSLAARFDFSTMNEAY